MGDKLICMYAQGGGSKKLYKVAKVGFENMPFLLM